MKIKCLLAILAVSTMLCVPAQAQEETNEIETQHEISLSYGVLPNSTWIDVLTDVIPAIFGQKTDNNRYFGPLSLEYYYHTSHLIGVGGILILNTNSQDLYSSDVLESYRTRSYYTIMPSVKFNWLRKNKWGMYSKVALGATYIQFHDKDYDQSGHKTGDTETTNDFVFNFQASLLGVEAGGNHVRGFAELGIGEQGILLGGVRYKF